MAWTNKMEDFKGDSDAQQEFLRTSKETGKEGHVAISFAPHKEAKVYITSEVADDGGEVVREDISFKTLRELAEQLQHLQVKCDATIADDDVRIVEELANWEDEVYRRFIKNGLPVSAEFYAEACHLLEAIEDKKIHAVLETHVREYVDKSEVAGGIVSSGVEDNTKTPNHNRGVHGQNMKQKKDETPEISIQHVPKKEEVSKETQSEGVLEAVPYNADVSAYIESLIRVAEARGDDDLAPEGKVQKTGVEMVRFLRTKLGDLLVKVEDPHITRRIFEKDPTVDSELKGWFTTRVKNTPLPVAVQNNIVNACIETAYTRMEKSAQNTVDIAKVVSLEKQSECGVNVEKSKEIPVENVNESPQVLEVRQETATHEESPAMSPKLRREIDTELEKWLGDTQVRMQALENFLQAYVQYVEAEHKVHGFDFLAAIFHQNVPERKEDLERMGNELLVGADTFVRDTEARMRTMKEVVAKLPEHESEAYAMLATLIETLRDRQNRLKALVLEEHRGTEVDPRIDSAILAIMKYAQTQDIPESVIPKETMRLETKAEADARLGTLHLETEHEAEVRTGITVPEAHTIEVPKRETVDLVEQLLQELDHVEVVDKKEEIAGVSLEKKEIAPLSAEGVLQGDVPKVTVDSSQEIEVHTAKELSGAEGVRAIRHEYMSVVGEKTGWEGIQALIAYLGTRDTVPSMSRGVVDARGVVRAIEVLTMVMPTERDGTPRTKVLVSPESPMYQQFIKMVPRGGLREIVLALVEGTPKKDIALEMQDESAVEEVSNQKQNVVLPEDVPQKPDALLEKTGELQDAQKESNEPESTPKFIAENVCKDFAESFNISKETLEAIPGFAELDPDRQRLVLHALKKYALLEVRTESERGYGKEVKESSGFMKKMWLGLTNAYQLNKRKQAITEGIFKRDLDETSAREQIKTIESLTEMAAQVRGVRETKSGEFELSVVGEKDFTPKNAEGDPRPLTPEEKQTIERYNQAVRVFGSLPSTLNMEVSWERNMYDEAKAEYTKAREELLALKQVCNEIEESLYFGNNLDSHVMLSQFLKSCPEVEDALLHIKDESVMKQTIIQMLATRGGYMALGGGVRWATTATLASAGATLAGLGALLAAPLAAGAVVGGVRGRIDARKTIARSEESIRTGGEWDTSEKGEASRVQKSTELVAKLDQLVARVEGELDEEKKEKMLVLLRDRLSYTQRRSVSDEVDFGTARQQAAARLDLLQAMARAQVVEGLDETTGKMQENFKGVQVFKNKEKGEYYPKREKRDTVSLEQRLSRVLGMRREMAKTKQEEFVDRRMWEGVKVGAAYALVGSFIADATRGLMASEDVPRLPEDVQDAGATNGGDIVEKSTELPKTGHGTEVPVHSEKGAVAGEKVIKVDVVQEKGSTLPDMKQDAKEVSIGSDRAHTEPVPLAEARVEPPVAPEVPSVRASPPSEEESVIRVRGEVSAEEHEPPTPDASPVETTKQSALESEAFTLSESVVTPLEGKLTGETVTLTHTYTNGDSVERALQTILRSDGVKEYQPNLTPDEIEKIASRIRIGLEQDPEMARAFGVQKGNWNSVSEGTMAKVRIPAEMVREAIDRFHPPEIPVGEEAQVVPDVSNRIAELKEQIARLETQQNQVPQEQLRTVEDQLARVREEIQSVVSTTRTHVEDIANELQAQIEAFSSKIDTIAKNSPEKVGIVPIKHLDESILNSKIFSGVSARLSHFSPTQIASSIGEIQTLYEALDEIPPLDVRIRETLSGVFTEHGLLKGYPKEHIDALRDMPDVWGVITLKDILDSTKGTVVSVGEKQIPLSETTETMFANLIYGMRIQGGQAVDAIVQRVIREGGTMLDLIKQAYPVLPNVYPV